MRLESFLCFDGTEISNAQRTLAYIQELGDPRWSVSLASDGSGLLACHCDVLAEETYSTPASDDAPWYEPNRGESGDFLGFVAFEPVLDPVIARSVTRIGSGGGVLSPSVFAPRILSVRGLMAARSPAGMAWGERWLTDVLSGGCDGDANLEVLPVCPPAAEDTERFFRDLLEVAVVDGPVFSAIGNLPECTIQSCEFQVGSQQPYLYGKAVTCLDEQLLAYGGSLDCLASTNDWVGDATLRIVLEADETDDVEDVLITLTPSLDGNCPTTVGNEPCAVYRVPTLTRSGRLTIDGRTRSVTYQNPTTKRDEPGLPLIQFEDGRLFQWPDLSYCSSLCIEISSDGIPSPSASGDVTVTVEMFPREL